MALTAAEQAELAQLEAEYGAKPQASSGGLTPQEQAELAQLEAQYGEQEKGFWDKAKEIGAGALDIAARTANIPGGIVRTGLGEVIDIGRRAAGYEPLITNEDALQSLYGRGISTSEYLRRWGVPAGYSLSEILPGLYSKTGAGLPLQKGGWADPTVRGAVGLAGDVASDPLTYLSRAAGKAANTSEEAAKAERIGQTVPMTVEQKALAEPGAQATLRPLETLSQKLGKMSYKSGLKRVDQEAAKYGKEPVSDTLMEYGISGSAKSIQNQMDDLAEKLLAERNAILEEGKKAGVEVSMKEAMAPTLERIAKIRASRDPALQPLADALEAESKKYLALDAKPAYTPIEVIPKKEVLSNLPRQGELAGGSTAIEVVPKQQVLKELPMQAKYQLADPYASLKGKVQGGDFVPRSVTAIDEIPGRIIPGKTTPDVFTPKAPLTTLEEIPGRIVPGAEVKAVPGVDPMTATGYKSSVTAALPDSAFRSEGVRKAAYGAEKEMGGGLRQAIENALQKNTGKGLELKELNRKLGGILTTKEKQAIEATKELNKNAVTSVDAMILGADKPGMLLLKKAADIGKMAGPRTTVGKYMNLAGKNAGGYADEVARQLYWKALLEKEQENQNQGR